MSVLGSNGGPSWVRRLLGNALQLHLEGRRWHEALPRLVSDLRPNSLLDLGCGDGSWSLELARRLDVPPERIYGTEVYPPLVKQAREKIKIFEIDLEEDTLPLTDQAVELVIANQVLEHLKNVFFCLAECERVLKVGGHLAVGIPNLAGLVNRVYLLLGRQPMCLEFPGPHVRAFTHRAFVTFIRSNPAFRLVRCLGSSLYPFPPPLLEAGARVIPSWSAHAFYLLEKVEHRPRSVWLNEAAKLNATPFKH